MRRVEYFSDNENEKLSEVQYFSLAQDIRLSKLPLKRRFQEFLKEFIRYVNTKKAVLDKETIGQIDELLISKFNIFINSSEEEVRSGGTLDIILGITQPEIKKLINAFTKVFRRMLISRDKLGYIPRDMQTKVDLSYKEVIAELRKLVFKPVLNLFSTDPNQIPEIENPELLTEGNPTIPQLYDRIIGYLRSENLYFKVEVKDNEIIIKSNEEV